MKAIFASLVLLTSLSLAVGSTTINAANRHAYGANIGWVNWRADTVNGAVIGEFVCSGYLYAANVGWMHLGGNAPADGIRYQNNSAADYGVNHDGAGNLRGYAYGANIGWVNFETSGSPRVDLKTGNFSGYAYSANCGWISLSNAFAHVQTDTLLPGLDSDGDGITDAWELSYTNTLKAFTAISDTDGDGIADLNESLADTSPLDADDFLRITAYAVLFGGGNATNTLTWTSKPTRCYQMDYRTNLNSATPWLDATGLVQPDPGLATTQMIPLSPSTAENYFRVQALKPLSP